MVCCATPVRRLHVRVPSICADIRLNRWTFGANRVQVDADVKVLSEFLSYLQTDSVRGTLSISSLFPSQSSPPTRRKSSKDVACDKDTKIVLDYVSRLKSINHPLRLLVENEIFRLAVWANPSNDVKRGTDHVGTSERNMSEVGHNIYPDICFAHICNIVFRVLGRRWFAPYRKSILPSRCTWQSDLKVLWFSLRSGNWFAQAPWISLISRKLYTFWLGIKWI
jgi:hypothetical protein